MSTVSDQAAVTIITALFQDADIYMQNLTVDYLGVQKYKHIFVFQSNVELNQNILVEKSRKIILWNYILF